MKTTTRNIVAVIIGLFIGGLLNGFIISISGSIISLPKGVDNTTIEGLQKPFISLNRNTLFFLF